MGESFPVSNTGKVGQHMVPMPHLGVILQMDDWRVLADSLEQSEQIEFIIPPGIRFAGEPGEQATMFFQDPFGNPIEIKGFLHFSQIYDA